MSVDPSVLIVTAIGCVSGLLIALQAIALDYFVNKTWMGWNITLKKLAFSVSSLSFLFGIGAFLLLNWSPAQSLGVSSTEIVPFFLKTGILISAITPISGQIRLALTQGETEEPDAP
ncbi:MAG: hypothetical protein AAFU53_01200 [Cyanobacteria bacterium J06632_3]|mgnify:CR=1 FL=1